MSQTIAHNIASHTRAVVQGNAGLAYYRLHIGESETCIVSKQEPSFQPIKVQEVT